MLMLAHRGLWRSRAEQNTLRAIAAALAAGFGVETDLRDRLGEIVVSHDMPSSASLPSFADLLALAASHPDLPLALNVKADGLQSATSTVLRTATMGSASFFFDMSVPDALGYLRRGLPCFTRESEYETEPSFLDAAAGVWMDCFEHDWITADAIRRHIEGGRQVALVSPELHGRDHRQAWAVWRDAERRLRDEGSQGGLLLCTDLPEEADVFFNHQ